MGHFRVRSRIEAAAAVGCVVLSMGAASCSALSSSDTGSAAAPNPPASATGSVSGAPPPTAITIGAPDCAGKTGIQVASAASLDSALAAAQPGQTIVLAPGVYQHDFVVTVSGTPAAPITLCGNADAVIQGDSIQHGYAFYLKRASWWRLEGFTVSGGQKGVVADGSNHDLFYGLYIHGTGDEAIHLRSFSSNNTISHCKIRQTGLLVQFYGEGIYVGSAHHNWCRYSGCQPDASNANVLIDNDISGTTAENIDIKEGTSGGTISGNHLDGTGMVSSAATAWVNVKGNNWTVTGNVGVNTIKDGFQVHQVYPGWGIGNVFHNNRASVNGPGYGIWVQSSRLQTIVACDNSVTGTALGLSNVTCTGA